MSEYVSEVRINTRLDNTGLVKGLGVASKETDRLTTSFNKQNEAIQRQSNQIAEMRRQYEAFTSGEKAPASLIAMERQLKRVSAEFDEAKVKSGKLEAQLEAAETALEFQRSIANQRGILHTSDPEAERRVSELKNQIEPLHATMESLSGEADKLRQNIAQIKLDPSTSAEAQALADKMQLANDKLEGMKDNANATHGALMQTFTANAAPLQEATKQVSDNTERAAKSAKQMSVNTDKAARSTKRLGRETRTAGTHAHKAAAGFGALAGRIMSLAKAALVFNVIRRALNELRKYMGALLRSNKDFMASWNAVKVNLLAAFAPIWEVIQPALVVFMNILAQATQILATFIALLFGRTYQQAKSTAKAMDDQAKAISGVGGAAQKAAKQLYGFDEINQAIQDSDGGGGGSGGALEFGGAKEYQLGASVLDFMEKAKEILANIWSVFQRAWEQEGAATIAAFSYALTGVGNMLLAIGRTWYHLWMDGHGQALIESLLRLLQSMLLLIGDIARAFTAAWEAGPGVSIMTHLFEIITNISDAITAILANLRAAWNENGNGIAIWTSILNIVDSVLASINRMSVATKNWAENLDFGPLIGGMRSLLAAIEPLVDIISDGLAWAYEEVLLPFGEWLVELAVPSALGMLEKAFGLLKTALVAVQPGAKWIWNNFFVPVGEWSAAHIVKQLDWLGEKFEEVAGVIEENGGVINGILEAIGERVSYTWEDWIKPILDFALDVVTAHVDNIIGTLGGFLTFLRGVFSGDLGTALAGIEEMFTTSFNSILDVAQSLVDNLTKILNGIVDNINKVITVIGIPKIPSIPNFTIPRLATGGVVGHGIYELGEDGKEAVIPLENNTGWIRSVAMQLGGELDGFDLGGQIMSALADKGARQGAGDMSDATIAKLLNGIGEQLATVLTGTRADTSGGGGDAGRGDIYLDARKVGEVVYDEFMGIAAGRAVPFARG